MKLKNEFITNLWKDIVQGVIETDEMYLATMSTGSTENNSIGGSG